MCEPCSANVSTRTHTQRETYRHTTRPTNWTTKLRFEYSMPMVIRYRLFSLCAVVRGRRGHYKSYWIQRRNFHICKDVPFGRTNKNAYMLAGKCVSMSIAYSRLRFYVLSQLWFGRCYCETHTNARTHTHSLTYIRNLLGAHCVWIGSVGTDVVDFSVDTKWRAFNREYVVQSTMREILLCVLPACCCCFSYVFTLWLCPIWFTFEWLFVSFWLQCNRYIRAMCV